MSSYGQYRPTRETYPVMDAMAVAVAINNAQGFVKAGKGSYNTEKSLRTEDNRTVALRTLRVMSGVKNEINADGNPDTVIFPTETDRQQAQEIYDHFSEIIVMAKLSDMLVVTSKDGRKNDYNKNLNAIFTAKSTDVSKELAMIVSLPNARSVSDKRAKMAEFYSANRENGYIGEFKARVNLTGHVIDVKYVPRHLIHLVTILTTENKIVMFIMNNKQSDAARRMVGTDVTFIGTVTKQEVNMHTGSQYTMLNRIRFIDPNT
jgi:hypothetical protein